MHWFIHLSFDSPLQPINGVSSDLQKLLKYFNDITNTVFFKIPFTSSALVFPNNLALYFGNLKLLPSSILALNLVASSLT